MPLNEKLLDLAADGGDLSAELRSIVGEDGAAHNGAGNTAGASEGDLGRDKDVGHVL